MLGGIGNYIMTTPMLKGLRDNLPDAEIVLITADKAVTPLATDEPLVDKIICIKGFNIIPLIKKIRSYHLDTMITATGTNPLKGSLLAFLSGARVRIGENNKGRGLFYNSKLPYFHGDHEVIGNIKLLLPLKISIDKPELVFRLSEKEVLKANKMIKNRFYKGNKKIVAIHPGSGERLKYKRWFSDRYSKLAKILYREFDCNIIFLGGTNEEKLIKDIINPLDDKYILNLAGMLSLRESAAVIKTSSLFISNDTGLMHIAAAVRKPLIAIFGPTMWHKTGPFGGSQGCIILKSDIDCSPCYDYQYKKCSNNFKCLDSIKARDVVEAVKEILSSEKN